MPYQQFGSDKVVLRAEFEIRMFALLPAETRRALTVLFGRQVNDQFEKIPVVVDLFDRSTGPKYGVQAVQLMEKYGRSPTRIGKELEINKRQACIALDYGKDLVTAGLTDPYIELHKPPASAGRWRLDRYHEKHSDDDAEPTAPAA